MRGKMHTFNKGHIRPGVGNVKPVGNQKWYEAINGDILIVENSKLTYRQKRLFSIAECDDCGKDVEVPVEIDPEQTAIFCSSECVEGESRRAYNQEMQQIVDQDDTPYTHDKEEEEAGVEK